MSLCVVLGAADGLLVLADGRRAQLAWTPGAPNWMGDCDTKLVVAPGAPIAVVTVGRAGFGEVDTRVFLQDEFEQMDDAERKDPSIVAARCQDLLTRLDREHARPHEVGTSTLVVGYDADGQRTMEAFHVPPRDITIVDEFDSYPALTFLPGSDTADELAAEFSLFGEVAKDQDARDDDWRWTAHSYHYHGMVLSEMRPLALTCMRDWLTANAKSATGDGGTWLVTERRPRSEAAVERVNLGPPGDASQNVPV